MTGQAADESLASVSRVRRAWLVWGVALAAYLLAIFHRSSLAVAGLAAADRFDISAAQLATFTMLQLLVYAGMQIPVGLLVDRFGPRSVMLTGAIVLTLAQAGFALAESYAAALVARVFVGMGDAMTWICLLRLVTSWFTGRRIPFAHRAVRDARPARRDRGGRADDLGAGPPRLDQGLPDRRRGERRRGRAVAVVVHDAPEGRVIRGPRLTFATIRDEPAGVLGAPGHPAGVLDALRHPVQRHRDDPALGLPVPRQGRGPSDGRASLLLSLVVVAVMYSGPTIGWFIGRHPWHRSTDGADHRLVDRRRVDGGARLAGRRAVLAPRRCSPRSSGSADRPR